MSGGAPDPVAVLFVELFACQVLGELGAPVGVRFFVCQTNALEEEAELVARIVLEVVSLSELGVHVGHAKRERAPAEHRKVGDRHLDATVARLREVVADVP